MSCEGAFIQKLREQGFRLTPQREMVLSAMHQVEGLTTAEQVFERVQSLSSAVDISTVYRTLDLLQEFGLVACVDPGDGQRRYELLGTHGPHIHLVCQACGRVLGVELSEARPLAKQLLQQHGFLADLDHLTVPGRCQECQNKTV